MRVPDPRDGLAGGPGDRLDRLDRVSERLRRRSSRRRRGGRGPGRGLVAVFGVFVLASGSRAIVQIATKFSVAPVAYVLSAVAAVVYVVAMLSLARVGREA